MEMTLQWEDFPDIGHYDGVLLENGKEIERIAVCDYTCTFQQEKDRKYRFKRPYAFEVNWCNGFVMQHGFDFDSDAKKRKHGAYQGNCTHTVEDVKRWCENWLAQRYMSAYYDTLKKLPAMEERAKWFENRGFVFDEHKND